MTVDRPGDTADPTTPSLLYAVKQVELAVRAHLDGLLRPAGVTAVQYTALTVLARRDGLTSAELARNSFVTAQSMTDLVTGLERRELITKTPDPANRRRLLIRLSDAGRAFLSDHSERVDRIEELMLNGLSGDERSVLRDLLNRCRAGLAADPPQ